MATEDKKKSNNNKIATINLLAKAIYDKTTGTWREAIKKASLEYKKSLLATTQESC